MYAKTSLLICLVLAMSLSGCGPRHVPTRVEQMQSQGYALQDNPEWSERIRGMGYNLAEHLFKSKGATLEHFFSNRGVRSMFWIGSNRAGKIAMSGIRTIYKAELTQLRNRLNAGETPVGTLVSANLDEENHRYLFEYIQNGQYGLLARVFTEKGWILMVGSSTPEDRNAITQLRLYYSSITLAPHLKYAKPASKDPSA